MPHEGVRIKTITRLYRFHDPDGAIARLGARGTSIDELIERARSRFIGKRTIIGNRFLTEGIEFIWRAATNATGGPYFDNANAHIGVGDGTVPEDPSQTGLTGVNKYYKRVDEGYPAINGNEVAFRATFGPDEANFEWNEWTVANGPGDEYVNLNRRRESLGTKVQGATWILTVVLKIY